MVRALKYLGSAANNDCDDDVTVMSCQTIMSGKNHNFKFWELCPSGFFLFDKRSSTSATVMFFNSYKMSTSAGTKTKITRPRGVFKNSIQFPTAARCVIYIP